MNKKDQKRDEGFKSKAVQAAAQVAPLIRLKIKQSCHDERQMPFGSMAINLVPHRYFQESDTNLKCNCPIAQARQQEMSQLDCV
jgi:hypothetical protein